MPITKKNRELGLIILNEYGRLKSKQLNAIQFPPMKELQHLQDVKGLIQELEEMEVIQDAEIKQETKVGE